MANVRALFVERDGFCFGEIAHGQCADPDICSMATRINSLNVKRLRLSIPPEMINNAAGCCDALPNHTQFLLTGGIGANVSSPTTFGVGAIGPPSSALICRR